MWGVKIKGYLFLIILIRLFIGVVNAIFPWQYIN